jgi:hypothetical protein
MGVDSVPSATRLELMRRIRDLQSPNRVPYKTSTPQPQTLPTFSLFSDDAAISPVDSPPWTAPARSRLFPGSERVASRPPSPLASPAPAQSRSIRIVGFVILALLVVAFIVLAARFPHQAPAPEDLAARYLHRLAGECCLPEHRAREDFLERLFPGLDIGRLAEAPGVSAGQGWMWSEAPEWALFCDPNIMHKQGIICTILFVVLMTVLVLFWCCR